MPENSVIAVATPRGPSLIAAHKRKGTIKRPKARLTKLEDNASRKTVVEAAESRLIISRASAHRRDGQCSAGLSIQVSTSGATTSAPTPSPIHHVSHRRPKLFQSAAPPTHRLALPIVALTIGLTSTATITNFRTSR